VKLYFLRHGIAEDVSSTGFDRDRALTDEGIAEMERAARGLKRLKLDLDLVLASPYTRARQTAAIVAHDLDLEDRLHEEPRLAPGFRLGHLQQIVAERPDARRILLVGHNFDLPTVAGQLAGGAEIDLKKGGLIRVDVDVIEPERGTLEWLLVPRHLIAMGDS
jgi:phosphohistidine phosphatase SixA